MGSQDLLLAVLGMVLIGIAITVAITMFQANAIDSSRSALIEDLLFFASRAREYYWKPLSLAGGNKDFSGLTINKLSSKTENDNGRYFVESASKDELVLVGIGRVVANGSDTIEVKMRVNEQSNKIEIIH